MGKLATGLAVTLALLGVPAASASTARIDIGGPAPRTLVVAGGGEANDVIVTRSVLDYFVDDAAGIAPADGSCSVVSATRVRCTGSEALLKLEVDLGAGDDDFLLGPATDLTPEVHGEAGEDDLDGVASVLGSVDGGADDDRVTGPSPRGGAGDDIVTGTPGSDILDGGPGADIIRGGGGTDAVNYLGRTGDLIVRLDDLLPNDGEAGENDLIDVDVEGVLGGEGDDLLLGNGFPNALSGNGGADRIQGYWGDDGIDGGPGDDVLLGEHGNDTLSGLAGRDDLSGGEGHDRLFPGAVQTIADGAPDRVRGGTGIDLVGLEHPDHALFCFFPSCPLPGASGVTLDDRPNDGPAGERDDYGSDIEVVRGDAAPNALLGTNADNRLDGGGGNDVLTGLGGRDFILGDAGDDRVEVRDGITDTVDCGFGNDSARADRVDVLRNCERVDLPPVPSENGLGDAHVEFAGLPRSLRFSRRYGAAFRLANGNDFAVRGTALLLRRGTRYARRSFRVRAHRSTRIVLRLGPRGRRVLRRAGRIRMSLRLDLRDADGARRTIRRTVTLLAPRARPPAQAPIPPS